MRVVQAARDVRRHAREPLFLHAYALVLSGIVTSGLGIVYWAIAARLYSPEIIGVNAALLSLVTFLGNISQLNLRTGFGRFVPIAAERTRLLIGSGYVAALAVAAVTGTAVVAIFAFLPDLLPSVRLSPALAILFPVTVVLWTAFILQDHVLVAFRRTTWVPIENGLFSVAKIVLVVLFVQGMGDLAILMSWAVATLGGVVIVSALIVQCVLPPRQRPSAPRPTETDGITARAVTRYIGADYLSSLFAIAATSLLPVIVLSVSGAAASAHFYIVILIGSAAQLLPAVLATSLLVETSASRATFEHDGRRVLRQILILLVPLIAVFVVAAPLILGLFGAEYAAEGSAALQLYAIASFPYSLLQLAFVRLRIEHRLRWIVAAQAIRGALLVGGTIVVLPRFGIAGVGAVALLSDGLVAAVLARTELWSLVFRGSRAAPVREG